MHFIYVLAMPFRKVYVQISINREPLGQNLRLQAANVVGKHLLPEGVTAAGHLFNHAFLQEEANRPSNLEGRGLSPASPVRPSYFRWPATGPGVPWPQKFFRCAGGRPGSGFPPLQAVD